MKEQKADDRTWEEIVMQVFKKAETDKDYAARKINPEWVINFIHNKVLPFEIDRDRRRNKVAVIERIAAIRKNFGLFELQITEDDTMEIGNQCKHAFLSNPTNLFIKTQRIIEKKGAMVVNVYPMPFVPVIDAIIIQYFKSKKVIPEE